MLELWLTTLGSVSIFFVVLYFFFLIIKGAVNVEDSYRIDKQPEKDPNDSN